MSKSKILIPSEVCQDDVVLYLAGRYHCHPRDIIIRFLEQEKLTKSHSFVNQPMEENELAILRELDLKPQEVEFT